MELTDDNRGHQLSNNGNADPARATPRRVAYWRDTYHTAALAFARQNRITDPETYATLREFAEFLGDVAAKVEARTSGEG